jgi:hypoxanthine phosphoribosyltransferase
MKKIVSRLSAEVKRDFQGRDPLFVVTLNGSFVFAADFLRLWGASAEVQFIRYKSYEGMNSSGKITPVMPIGEEVAGRDVIILEDIVDTGNTMYELLRVVDEFRPNSVSLVSLFSKPEVLNNRLKIDYLGKELPNKFIVGFGLDYDGHGRNLPAVYVVEP